MCNRKFHEWFYKDLAVPTILNLPEEDEEEMEDLVSTSTSVLARVDESQKFVQENRMRLEKIGEYGKILDGDMERSVVMPQAKTNMLLPDYKTDTLFKGENIQIEVGNNAADLWAGLKVKRVCKNHNNAGMNEKTAKEYLKSTPFSQDAVTDSSSVYYEVNALKFKDSIRMCFCSKHHTSILMASIRYNQLDLTEFIVRQVKESEDIDKENIYGDTALTLACRLGKLEFVEFLVQNGADINKETSNGRTALIEAVKSPQEHVPLVEYLIREGCIVAYKTKRHGRTALDWARRYALSEENALVERHLQNTGQKLTITVEKRRLLGRPRTVRILELAAVVQRQSNILFIKIAVGENAYVLKSIENGDFFDPQTEEKCYKYMEEFVVKSEKCDEELNEIQTKMNNNGRKVDIYYDKKIELNKSIKDVEFKLNACYSHEKDWDSKINFEFQNFEKSLSYILSEDLEEIARFSLPSNILLLTLYISGVVLDLFPKQYSQQTKNATEDYSYLFTSSLYANLLKQSQLLPSQSSDGKNKISKEFILSEQKKWWFNILLKLFLIKSNEIKHKLQSFTRAKLHIERCKDLFYLARYFLRMLNENLNDAAHLLTGKKDNNITNKEFLFLMNGGTTTSSRPSSVERGGNTGEIPEDLSLLPVPSDDFVNPSNTRPKSRLGAGVIDPNSPSSSGMLIKSPSSMRPITPKKSVEQLELEALEKEYFDEDEDFSTLQGTWVKGEWVPKLKNKHKQSWELEEGEDLLTQFEKEAKEMEAQLQQSILVNEQHDRLLYLSDEIIQDFKKRTIQEIKARNKSGEEVIEFNFNSNVADIPLLLAGGEKKRDGEESVSRASSPFRKQKSTNLSRTSSSSSILSNGTNFSPVSSPKMKKRKFTLKSTEGKQVESEDGGGSDNDDDGFLSNLSSPKSALKKGKSHRKLSSSSRKKKKDKDGGKKYETEDDYLLTSNPLENYSQESLVGYAFIQTIVLLLKSIIRYDIYYSKILQQKRTVMGFVNSLEDMKRESIETIDEYEKQMLIRSKFEKEYIKLLKRNKFIQEKLFIFRDRVRIARLMNFVSVNGHSLISWTATYGNYEVMEALLSRGGTVGFNSLLLNLTATYLQLSYKIYRIMLQKYSLNHPGKNPVGITTTATATPATPSAAFVVDGSLGHLKKAANIQIIQELTKLKDKRSKLLFKIHYFKHKMRFPIPEAIYAGKWEIVSRIYERRLWHCHFMNTWAFPSPAPPFQRDLSHQYEHRKLSPLDLVTYAMNNLAAGAYIAEKGWVPPNHPSEPYGELSILLEKLLFELKEKQTEFRANRFRIRALVNERNNQKTGEQEMIDSIYKKDYRHCIWLAENRGITIDLETPDGSTALISAAEEDCDAVNHELMVNDDGSRCLQVVYLLDRHYYRPAINLETTAGYTALLRACVLGRTHVVVALLDRGAKIDYVNKFGKSAIHYVAALGHSEIMRILVERFADLTLKDNRGFTAYEIAERENYTNLMTLLSQFKSGNLGHLQLTRGRVNNQITCPNGCGKILFAHEKTAHLAECVYRIVPCPNNCSRTDLLFKEIPEHCSLYCEYRKIPCEQCHEDVELGQLKMHQAEECNYRKVACPLKCDKVVIFCEVNDHLKTKCAHRKVPCTLFCSESVRECDMIHHISHDCRNRRVTCPNKCHHPIIAFQLEMHLSSQCPQRMVECPQCHDSTVLSKDYDYHVKELCGYRLINCPEKCSIQIPVCQLSEHLAKECLHKVVPCPNNCSYQVQRKFLERHLLKECENRLVPCPNQCVNHERSTFQETVIQCIPGKLLAMHVKSECPERLITCSLCQLSIKSKYLLLHQKNDCLQRSVHCSNEGCSKEIVFQLLNQHEFHECRFRKIPCPQGCDVHLPWLYSKAHMQKECPMRFLSCTNGCGEKMRFYDLEAHLQDACPRRFSLEETKDPYAVKMTKSSTSSLKTSSTVSEVVSAAKNAEKNGAVKKKGKEVELSQSLKFPDPETKNSKAKSLLKESKKQSKSSNDLNLDKAGGDDDDDSLDDQEKEQVEAIQEKLLHSNSSLMKSLAYVGKEMVGSSKAPRK
jgi:ankyrin repeat protein